MWVQHPSKRFRGPRFGHRTCVDGFKYLLELRHIDLPVDRMPLLSELAAQMTLRMRSSSWGV